MRDQYPTAPSLLFGVIGGGASFGVTGSLVTALVSGVCVYLAGSAYTAFRLRRSDRGVIADSSVPVP